MKHILIIGIILLLLLAVGVWLYGEIVMLKNPVVYDLTEQDLANLEEDIQIQFPEGSCLEEAYYCAGRDSYAAFYVTVPLEKYNDLLQAFSKFQSVHSSGWLGKYSEYPVLKQYYLDTLSNRRLNYSTSILKGKSEYIVVIVESPTGKRWIALNGKSTQENFILMKGAKIK